MMQIVRLFLGIVSAFFVLYMMGYSSFLFLSVVVGSSTLYGERRKEGVRRALLPERRVPVSIIVPAHNEQLTVTDTVASLLALNYRDYEIIVVDDGSEDDTSAVLIRSLGMHPIRRPIPKRLDCGREELIYETMAAGVPVTLIRKEKGGKADALNMGINCARHPYFLCMDADSVLQSDSLEKIVRPVLEEEHVVAVGGVVRPCNGAIREDGHLRAAGLPRNVLCAMQVLEYDRSFLAARILFDKFNGSLIISGAFGLFHKETVIAAGGYDRDTMGEDMELIVKLHEFCKSTRRPYRVRYASDAVCWTQVPETLRDLCRQRRRWHIGLLQTMWRHRALLTNPQYGPVSFVSCLYFWLYELLSPVIELVGLLSVLLAWRVGLLNVPFMLLLFAVYTLFGVILTITAFFARIYTAEQTLSPGDLLRAVLLCVLEVVVLRTVLALQRMGAMLGYRREKNQWGAIRRRQMVRG